MRGKEGEGGKMPTHTVIIRVDNDGNITYQGKPMILADRGDTVVWKCANRSPFAIHFVGGKTPMQPSYQSDGNTPVQDTIPMDAEPDAYTYMVAVCIDNVIWTDDPPFIVKPPSG